MYLQDRSQNIIIVIKSVVLFGEKKGNYLLYLENKFENESGRAALQRVLLANQQKALYGIALFRTKAPNCILPKA